MSIPTLSNKDDLLNLVGDLKSGLITRATGKGYYDDAEYQRIRKLLLSNSSLVKLIPKFLRDNRNVDDFWRWIKTEDPHYEGRRRLLTEQLSPLLDAIEYETGEGALEFSKNYEEKELIGNGGFGMVYKYEHRLLKMPFAVKVFAPAFYQDGSQEKELERFFQEAKILFKLNHPCVIRIYDAGMIGNRPFIRMEFFDGKNLNQILQDHGALSEDKARVAMINIISAIAHAHSNGIIHRDLKPSNIMASKPEQFRVIDFGLGIFVENELHSRLTKTGSQTISGYYNAPELVANPKLIDKRSDIYSLGAVWYTLLTGQPPAGNNQLSILRLQGITESTIKIIGTCLDPIETRFTDCSKLLMEIEKAGS